MRNKLQGIRYSIMAALMTLSVVASVLAVAPVQAAAPQARLSEGTESTAMKGTFDFRLLYSADTARPSAMDAAPLNVIIMRNGVAVAHAYNLKWGQRYAVTLANGIYQVQVWSRTTGKLINTFNLERSTRQKDNDLIVVLRMPASTEFPRRLIKYGMRAI